MPSGVVVAGAGVVEADAAAPEVAAAGPEVVAAVAWAEVDPVEAAAWPKAD